ncbi:hypothetical protein pipiens_005605 [Culex pipiens pipiens]|uniref:EGF-like domain-containing protein n=1 Tax=Culex pipiens pipiens TaxID=38569 RepID=A0ABD1DVB5_CULPP
MFEQRESLQLLFLLVSVLGAVSSQFCESNVSQPKVKSTEISDGKYVSVEYGYYECTYCYNSKKYKTASKSVYVTFPKNRCSTSAYSQIEYFCVVKKLKWVKVEFTTNNCAHSRVQVFGRAAHRSLQLGPRHAVLPSHDHSTHLLCILKTPPAYCDRPILTASFSFQLDYSVSKKQVCCDGYYGNGTDCVPVCRGGCENGRCTGPETCTCNAGYSMVSGRCVPSCVNGCANGSCVAPNQCVCGVGFVKSTAGACVPKCADDCVNGVCNERNECECREGFYFNEKLLEFGVRNNTVCTARCDFECRKGFCAGRNRCQCLEGYELSKSDRFECVPVCDSELVDCSNGECVAPNHCRCSVGFRMEGSRCVPVCNPSCVNADCTDIDQCTCRQGYRQTSESNVCEPTCDPPCEHGDCVGVNKCSCHNGYRAVNGSSCEPLCDSRFVDTGNGICIAPNVVRCNKGFELMEGLNFKLHCVSKCKPECVNGDCTAEGGCECHPGHQLKAGSVHECEPVCDPACEFGTCVRPNECECAEGYRKSVDDRCEFFCDPAKVDCTVGNCSSVDVCDCPEGYEFVEDTDGILRCLPICNPNCINGRCTDVNVCECFPEYQRINESLCKPVCDEPCVNGFCSGTNACSCSAGFTAFNATSCVPFCDPNVVNCSHGECVRFNVCDCFDGYRLFPDGNGTLSCAAFCADLPQHAVCVVPGEYHCLTGYAPGSNGSCGPVCEQDCGNGSCSAPNQCECLAGYSQDSTGSCTVTICEDKCSAEAGVCEDLRCKCNVWVFEPGDLVECCIAPEVCNCKQAEKIVGEDSFPWLFVVLGVVVLAVIIVGAVLLNRYLQNKRHSNSYECKYDQSRDKAAIIEKR